ncbi:MAG TPA: hypothetical protein VHO66_04260, partial [Ruminiclostridium sp.]|nr:hypothetical protein [Ruminiclostridium sp.]
MLNYIKRFKYYNSKNLNTEDINTSDVSGKPYTDDELQNMKISSNLAGNIDTIKKILGNSSDLVITNITLGRV